MPVNLIDTRFFFNLVDNFAASTREQNTFLQSKNEEIKNMKRQVEQMRLANLVLEKQRAKLEKLRYGMSRGWSEEKTNLSLKVDMLVDKVHSLRNQNEEHQRELQSRNDESKSNLKKRNKILEEMEQRVQILSGENSNLATRLSIQRQINEYNYLKEELKQKEYYDAREDQVSPQHSFLVDSLEFHTPVSDLSEGELSPTDVPLTAVPSTQTNSEEANTLAKDQKYYDSNYKQQRKRAKSGGSILWNFLKTLRPGMDLVSVTCPSFILRPQSQLEVQAEISQPTSQLMSAHSEVLPTKRMALVAQWAIHVVSQLPQKGFEELKPYNPILGERFNCSWQHEDGSSTVLSAEQVSHHPPISATFMINQEHGITFNSSQQITVGFRGNYIDSIMSGKHVLTIKPDHTKVEDHYVIVFPSVYATGLIFGDSAVELGDCMTITCKQTNCVCEVSFRGNSVNGFINHIGNRYCTIKGKLTETINFIERETKLTKWNLNLKEIVKEAMLVHSLEKQMPNESRRVWNKVTIALKQGDMELASKEKSEVEESQRAIAKTRTHAFVPSIFTLNPNYNKEEHVYVYKENTNTGI
jgi:hypothetical protein